MMGYLAFTEGAAGNAGLLERAVPKADVLPTPVLLTPGLSALEWSIVAIAERDRLSTLRRPGRVAMAIGALFGDHQNPRLADPKLEALRRMAVLSWHHGYAVPPAEVRAFMAAGFVPDQYQALLDSISAARARNARRGR